MLTVSISKFSDGLGNERAFVGCCLSWDFRLKRHSIPANSLEKLVEWNDGFHGICGTFRELEELPPSECSI